MALAQQKQSNDGLDQDSYYILASQNMKACQPWYIGSVVDPDSFNLDTYPDPGFQMNPATDPDPGFWRPKI